MRSPISRILCFVISVPLFCQDYPPPSHQLTSAVAGARFEIIQSPLAAKWTFRLDRYSGRVWQLVKTTEDDNGWEETFVFGLPKIQSTKHPRFQLFTSGIAARHTFLLDSESGKTWCLTSSKGKDKDGVQYDYNSWQPFAE
jgi:hypothetical protein